MSTVLPGNILPSFLFLQGDNEGGSTQVPIGGGRGTPQEYLPDDSCDDDIFDGLMEDLRSPQLPYLTLDQWDCARTPTNIPVWVLENQYLKATITPQWGGRIWSLYHKIDKRDLVYNNPAHQPANIAVLKAWTSGGIEWNWSPGIIGHSVFSENPTWMARVPTEQGDIIRLWEYDRYNNTVWQVDIFLDNDILWIHPKITNSDNVDLRGYWWTCTAHHVTPASRILTPATSAAQTSAGNMVKSSWPYFAEILNTSFKGIDGSWPVDNSYLGNIIGGDFFVRIPQPLDPYIAHLDNDGYVIYHGHSLNGTKFFTWGQIGPGRFMQDFLAGGETSNRVGDYAELQIGPAPTQMQNWPLPAKSVRQWTEFFKSYQGDNNTLHSNDYNSVLNSVANWRATNVPPSKVNNVTTFLDSHADDPINPSNILVQGTSWGGLYEKISGRKIAPGTFFNISINQDTSSWLNLLVNGTFSDTDLLYTPTSFQVTTPWINLIQTSANTYGYTWLHYLHLGIYNAEAGSVNEPIFYFQQSMKLKPTAIAARCLAVLSSDYNIAYNYYQQSFELALSANTDPSQNRLIRNLASEICFFLQSLGWINELTNFVKLIPQPYQTTIDAVITSNIKINVNQGNYSQAIQTLSTECFPTYASARSELMNLWNQAQELTLSKSLGRKLTPTEKHQVHIQNPVPRNIGCPYGADYCLNYW